MVVSVHTLAGAMLSELPFHAVIIFFISFFSHFLIDMIPHGDEHVFKGCPREMRLKSIKKFITLDLTVSFTLILFCFIYYPSSQYIYLFAGIFGNLLPDLLVVLHEIYKFKFLEKFHRLHTYFHDFIKFQPKFGLFLQLIIFLILFTTVI